MTGNVHSIATRILSLKGCPIEATAVGGSAINSIGWWLM